ncbi:hypothetical protein MSP8886_02838 [Marinomonas spartinae]|uniref:GmrSD restriction endonucleases N-terminal domain-containing protein n=1 Tax=Marinomonas spartinae TaxID=1792290 RepID=A0A1A8TL11_9GAMM|nr:DUF262 domain-containing protein [Marinomonas spartinae]SBS33687.1 hypothetical protein MSP8886_02838 [Marinomonas spartinae]
MQNNSNNHSAGSMVAIENLFSKFQYALSQSHDENVTDFMEQLHQLVQGNNALILKSMTELLPLHFFVDDYQRGYKWTPQQVKDLLNDIDEFTVTQSGFYCLQPVVVKYQAPQSSKDKSSWELIDGQQRMTTSYMILSFLQHSKFTIDYRTRKSSGEFLAYHLPSTLQSESWQDYIENYDSELNEQKLSSGLSSCNLDNVDNYHFYTAYCTIAKWFENKNDQQKQGWLNKFLNHTKVIWYAALDMDAAQNKQKSIDIFMRLNSGKIPLTNAELIKALFLHYANAEELTEVARLKQSQMAQQWDSIEHSLQNQDFWAFLQPYNKENKHANHIELLFDLLTNKPIHKANTLESQDAFFSFNHYYRELKQAANKAEFIDYQWHQLRQGFYRLQEWFENDELYHLTGFLITRSICNIQTLWKMSERVTKSEFVKLLKARIAKELVKYFTDETKNQTFSALQYGGNRQHIISVLILFNIAAHRKQGTRLSFNTYANTQWDIEHIHAQNSQQLDDSREQDIWYSSQQALIESEDIPKESKAQLLDSLTQWNSLRKIATDDEENRLALKASLQEYTKQLGDVVGVLKEEEMDGLDNLCLLSAKVNRGIGNAIFAQKRKLILQYEKGINGKQKQCFIPIATKNVFSKFYSENVSHMHQWSTEDRKAYRNELIACFNFYSVMEGLA